MMDLRHRHVPWEVFEDPARWAHPRPRDTQEQALRDRFRAESMAADLAHALRVRGVIVPPTAGEREQAAHDRAQALDEVTR